MIIDHMNAIWFGHKFFMMLLIGRGAFPLFCYAAATAVQKTKTVLSRRYMIRMSLLAIISQPFYYFALGGDTLNIIFTLALGGLLAGASPRLKLWQMYVLYTGAIASTLWAVPLQFGLPGVMLPSAILLVQRGHKSAYAFLLLLLLFINAGGMPDNTLHTLTVAPMLFYTWICLAAIFIPLLVLDAARHMPQTGRLLPKYALHIFYPAHLLLLKGAGMVLFK